MSNMKQVKLGSQGLVVPAIGLGCMGMTPILGYGDVFSSHGSFHGVIHFQKST
jgi:aryl-alcohol dehydrogenase-like predicted oxidoreductase